MLVPDYGHKGKFNVVWCGPYKVVEVLNKGENVKLDIPAPFDGLRVSNGDRERFIVISTVCLCLSCCLLLV